MVSGLASRGLFYIQANRVRGYLNYGLLLVSNFSRSS